MPEDGSAPVNCMALITVRPTLFDEYSSYLACNSPAARALPVALSIPVVHMCVPGCHMV
jgi:hypothetical protein